MDMMMLMTLEIISIDTTTSYQVVIAKDLFNIAEEKRMTLYSLYICSGIFFSKTFI